MASCTEYYFSSRQVQHGMVEGLCFLSKYSYMYMTELIFLTVRNYFPVMQYLATGFFTLSLAQSGYLATSERLVSLVEKM